MYTEKELFHFSVITVVRTYVSLACPPLLSCPSTSKSPLEFELQFLPLTQTQIMEYKLLIKLCNCHPGLPSWGCYKPDSAHNNVGIYAWLLWSRWHGVGLGGIWCWKAGQFSSSSWIVYRLWLQFGFECSEITHHLTHAMTNPSRIWAAILTAPHCFWYQHSRWLTMYT